MGKDVGNFTRNWNDINIAYDNNFFTYDPKVIDKLFNDYLSYSRH